MALQVTAMTSAGFLNAFEDEKFQVCEHPRWKQVTLAVVGDCSLFAAAGRSNGDEPVLSGSLL